MTNLLIIADVVMIHINSNFDVVCEKGIGPLLHNAETGLLITPNICKSS